MPKSKIRFYEKHGLFSDNQAANGYRYYSYRDAFRINAFRALLQYGFTVGKAIAMLDRKQSSEEFVRSLQNKKRTLEREIQLLGFRRERIERTLELIASDAADHYEIRDVGSYLYVAASDGEDFSLAARNADLIERFNSVLEVSRCARVIKQEDLFGEGDIVQPSYIIAIPESAAHLLPDGRLGAARRIVQGRSLCWRRTKTRRESLRRDSYEPLLAYLKTHRLRVRGDILLLPTFLNLDGDGSDIEELIVPIEENALPKTD